MYCWLTASYWSPLVVAVTVSSTTSLGPDPQAMVPDDGEPVRRTDAKFPPRLNLTGIAEPAFATFVMPGLSTGWKKPVKWYRNSARTNGDSEVTLPQITMLLVLFEVVTSVHPPVPPWNSLRLAGSW